MVLLVCQKKIYKMNKVFFIIGLIFIVISCCLKLKEIHTLRFWKQTEGEIVHLEPIKDFDFYSGNTSYIPHCRYFVDSQEYIYEKQGLAFHGGKVKIGDKVTILYHPQKPQKAMLKDDNDHIGCLIFGIWCIILSFSARFLEGR